MESENKDQLELEKNSKALKMELLKLNTLMSKNAELSQALQQENTLMEADFLLRLKAGLTSTLRFSAVSFFFF